MSKEKWGCQRESRVLVRVNLPSCQTRSLCEHRWTHLTISNLCFLVLLGRQTGP